MSQYPKTFADYPQSISELRGADDRNAATWTPRDAVISALRSIDEGLEVDAAIVVMRVKTAGGVTETYFRQCGPDIHTSFGLLEMAKIEMVSSAVK